jgi:hypothetical protein
MTYFEKLDEYLSGEFSPDYWYDEAHIYAIELLSKMTDNDWNMLKRQWRDRSSIWQERCAYILSDADSSQAIPLLLEMLKSTNNEVILTAADALRSIDIAKINLSLHRDVVERLQLLSENNPIAKVIVDEIIKQQKAVKNYEILNYTSIIN